VLLVDPGAVDAVRAAGSRYAGHPDPEQLREWIEGSLSALEYLRKNTGGDLQLRVTPAMPHVGIPSGGRPYLGRSSSRAALRSPAVG
jgi:hypothetical protein